MACNIVVEKIDEVYDRIITNDKGVDLELWENFTFMADNYAFHPKYRSGVWDGKIRLFDIRKRTLAKGLRNQLIEFCNRFGYTYSFYEEEQNDFDRKEIDDYYSEYRFIKQIKPETYQLNGLEYCVRNPRAVILSPTGSGKSLTIYMIIKEYLEKYDCRKVLLIVPRVDLVNQLADENFIAEYGANAKDILKIYGGVSRKNIKEKIVVTTWQSIQNEEPSFYEQFDMIIGDEVHTFTAKKLMGIMNNAKNVKYRFGFTGTIGSDSKTNKLTLISLFGDVYTLTDLDEMIDIGRASKPKVYIIVLDYSEEEKKSIANMIKQKQDVRKKYNNELLFIHSHEKRNNFIINLMSKLKDQKLLLFNRIDEHGKPLYEKMLKKNPDNTFYISGEVDKEDRAEIRKIFHGTNGDLNLLASYQTTQLGINLPNLKRLIFASPTRNEIRLLQSIGRVLRITDEKNKVYIYDIADNLCYKKTKNYTFRQLAKRLEIYEKNNFDYEVTVIKI